MAICTPFIEPLNLQCLLVNTLAGNAEIFLAIAFIVLASIAAFFRMTSMTFFAMFGLFLIFMYPFLNVGLWVFLFVLIGGILVMIPLARTLKD